MSEWQPIETAPRDGTSILLSDGKRFAAGSLAFRIEEDWKYLGYDEGLRCPNGWLKIGPRFLERIQNPDAGKRNEWWSLNGCSAFDADTDVTDDEGRPDYFEPTHWMPPLDRPLNTTNENSLTAGEP